MHILAVDDDRIVRTMLNKILTDWGHEVVLAEDGLQAWQYVQENKVDLVISDWMMPEMNGPELVAKIRELEDRYVYTMLLTAKNESADLVEGLDAGADDFISKPLNIPVIRARVRAASRLIQLENDLSQRNASLRETNRKLEKAKLEIQRDLEAGAHLQRSLLPSLSMSLAGYKIEWLYLPHSVVAGDIFNFKDLNDDYLVFYLVDVVGHGIPSALLTVTVSKMLSSDSHEVNPTIDAHSAEVQSAASVLGELNRRFQADDEVDQYFTIVYGTINTRTGEVQCGQAGHPSPVLVNPAGQASLVGEGGFPIGWLPGLEYDDIGMTIEPAGRLILYSDGVTECANPDGDMFTDERLRQFMEENHVLPLNRVVERLSEELDEWRQNRPFGDDVSLLAIERI